MVRIGKPIEQPERDVIPVEDPVPREIPKEPVEDPVKTEPVKVPA